MTLLLRPLVRLCVEKLHFNRKAASALFVVLFYGTIGLLVVLLVIKLIGYIGILIARLPEFFNQTVTPALNAATSKLSELIENFDAHGTVDIDETAAKVISSLSTAISDFSGKALAFVGSYATSVPSLLLNIVITIISTVFMLMDYDSIKAFIVRQLPDEKEALHRLGRGASGQGDMEIPHLIPYNNAHHVCRARAGTFLRRRKIRSDWRRALRCSISCPWSAPVRCSCRGR